MGKDGYRDGYRFFPSSCVGLGANQLRGLPQHLNRACKGDRLTNRLSHRCWQSVNSTWQGYLDIIFRKAYYNTTSEKERTVELKQESDHGS
jgi:hypothetical protein